MFPRYLKSFFGLSNRICKRISLPNNGCGVTTVRNERFFGTSTVCHSNYEGDGKTTVSILNIDYNQLVLINTMSTHGFRLNNGIFVVGPVAVFPRTVLQWNAATASDITPESLSLFCLLEPKIDILVIGTGDKSVMPSKEAMSYLKSHKISPEILSTENAIATFNYLNVEGRCVAGAFLCPTRIVTLVEKVATMDFERKQLETFYQVEEYDPHKKRK